MKSATQQFIEDAIAGGWKFPIKTNLFKEVRIETTLEQILLDPLAWQAVGKMRKWDGSGFDQEWRHKMHHFIDHLADGRTTEEVLSALSPS